MIHLRLFQVFNSIKVSVVSLFYVGLSSSDGASSLMSLSSVITTSKMTPSYLLYIMVGEEVVYVQLSEH